MKKPTAPSNKETYTYRYVRADSWKEAKFLSDEEYVQYLETHSVDMDDDYDDENRLWPEEAININELVSFYETLPKDVLWILESDYDSYLGSSCIVISGIKDVPVEEYNRRYNQYLRENEEYKRHLKAAKEAREESKKLEKLEKKKKQLQKLQKELKELEG